MSSIHRPGVGAASPDRASTRVVETVARAENLDPVKLDEPLYHSIDPDALDCLIGGVADIRIEFTYLDYRIRVDGDGNVRISD